MRTSQTNEQSFVPTRAPSRLENAESACWHIRSAPAPVRPSTERPEFRKRPVLRRRQPADGVRPQATVISRDCLRLPQSHRFQYCVAARRSRPPLARRLHPRVVPSEPAFFVQRVLGIDRSLGDFPMMIVGGSRGSIKQPKVMNSKS